MMTEECRLGELITCSICLEILDNPVILSCLHRICKNCADDLQKFAKSKRKIICPECKAHTKREKVKVDFKMCQIINAYRDFRAENPFQLYINRQRTTKAEIKRKLAIVDFSLLGSEGDVWKNNCIDALLHCLQKSVHIGELQSLKSDIASLRLATIKRDLLIQTQLSDNRRLYKRLFEQRFKMCLLRNSIYGYLAERELENTRIYWC